MRDDRWRPSHGPTSAWLGRVDPAIRRCARRSRGAERFASTRQSHPQRGVCSVVGAHALHPQPPLAWSAALRRGWSTDGTFGAAYRVLAPGAGPHLAQGHARAIARGLSLRPATRGQAQSLALRGLHDLKLPRPAPLSATARQLATRNRATSARWSSRLATVSSLGEREREWAGMSKSHSCAWQVVSALLPCAGCRGASQRRTCVAW